MADDKHDDDVDTTAEDEKRLKDAEKKLALTARIQATAHSLLGKN